jgi:hypothetical protein
MQVLVYRFLSAFQYVSFVNLVTYEVTHFVYIWFDPKGYFEIIEL